MRYRTIVADPPWDYSEGFVTVPDRPHRQDREAGASGEGTITRRELPYASMSLEDIARLPIPELAAKDARLFLWTTNRYLPAALDLIDGWGFVYKQTIVWDKTPNIPPFGGSVARNAAEFLLVAVRGAPWRVATWPTSVIRARRGRTTHSQKPDVFLDLVEEVSPQPYLEMFARRARFGWDYWGDQSLGTAELPSADEVRGILKGQTRVCGYCEGLSALSAEEIQALLGLIARSGSVLGWRREHEVAAHDKLRAELARRKGGEGG